MYLAPLNYDRFFKKIFSDLNIAKRFLEDFLDITIESIESLPLKHKLTDQAMAVEFDFRCKIDGEYVIIDMQQWYKTDVAKRFYAYHAVNTALQLDLLPTKKTKRGKDGKEEVKTVREYHPLLPVITLVWMVHDSLGFTDDYVAFQMLPTRLKEFVQTEIYWKPEQTSQQAQERSAILNLLANDHKEMTFLQQNHFIFMFQKNIVKNGTEAKYRQWFDFAAKTQNDKNTKEDFSSYRTDDVFAEMIRRLSVSRLESEDYNYMWYFDQFSYLHDKFVKESLEEGIQQGKKQSARKMLAIGLPISTIVECTGLSIATIEAIQSEDSSTGQK